MKYLFVFVFVTVACHMGAQQSPQTWLSFRSVENLHLEDALKYIHDRDDLGAETSFRRIRQYDDQLGMRHHTFQQYHAEVPIEGATVVFHEKNGIIQNANGLIVRGTMNLPSSPIAEEEAYAVVRRFYGDIVFFHEKPEMEAWIRKVDNDDKATFFPKGQLVLMDREYGIRGEDYKLCWKFDLFLEQDIDHVLVYVDAAKGRVCLEQPLTTSGCFGPSVGGMDHGCKHESASCMTAPRLNSGYTYYNGVQEFVADSLGSNRFELRDNTRGGGIITYNALRGTNINAAQVFSSDSSFWDLRNGNLDEAAIDAHWAAQQTYDYWLEKFNWRSYDGQGSPLRSYVHWDVDWNNATWNGRFARFGDGSRRPLTYIDITAHEFTHGLTGNTARLVYRNESGALNESFSDIFGTAVEFYALGKNAPLSLGRPDSPFRSMSNPKAHGDPDTYLGDNWVTGTADNGGVHTNSGVQNYWFYLLSFGGAGTNDNGMDYQVDSLGMDKAAAIAFRNLTLYLNASSTYIDARYGSLFAAMDLYGACSPEVRAVSQAWAAVGIGSLDITTDLEPLGVVTTSGGCDLTDQENLRIAYTLNPTGCDVSLAGGKQVSFGYIINDQPAHLESIVLGKTLFEGDIATYDFVEKMDLSIPGQYDIKVWVEAEDDLFSNNDTFYITNVVHPVTFDKSPTKVIFRNPTRSLDSFYVKNGTNAVGEMSTLAKNSARFGIFGFYMTGMNASLDNVVQPRTPEEIFTLNKDFESNLCFCVDATDWEDVYVSFDYRQLYSLAYPELIGIDNPQAASMRLLLNGNQIGDIYHPLTNIRDDWQSDTFSLTEVAGSRFEFCFQGKHFIDRLTDKNLDLESLGDATYIDEISFFDPNSVGTRSLVLDAMEAYPNPGSDELILVFDAQRVGEANEVEIYDVRGGRVGQYRIKSASDGRVVLNVQELPAGVYEIVLTGDQIRALARWTKI